LQGARTNAGLRSPRAVFACFRANIAIDTGRYAAPCGEVSTANAPDDGIVPAAL